MREVIEVTDVERYGRLQQLSWWSTPVVRGASAVVAGAGALGNEVLKNLLLLGWGHIVLVDFDSVEASNLTRSVLFRERHVGQTKLAAAIESAREINPSCQIEGLQGDLRLVLGAGLVSRCDVVFGCLDNLDARLALSALAGSAGALMIDGGLSEWEGTVSLYCAPEGPCFGCNLDRDDLQSLRLRRSCGAYAERAALQGGVPTTPVLASITAGIMVQQGLKYIHGLVESGRLPFGHQLRVDTAFNRSWCYELPRNPACPFHPERRSAQTLAGVNDAASWRTILELVRQQLECAAAVLHMPQPILEKWHCPVCGAQGAPAKTHVLGEPFKCTACGSAAATTLFNQVTGTECWLEATPAETGFGPLVWLTAVLADDVRVIEISRSE